MKGALHDYRRVFGSRDAVLVLFAGVVSMVGDAMAMIALLLRAHASGQGPYAATGLLVCFALPVVASMGLAGAIGDRYDSRRVLVLGGLVQAGGALALALVSGYTATLVGVLIMQAGFAVTNPVWGSVIPRIVGRDLIGPLVSLQQGIRGIASPLGAGLGGFLVQSRGEGFVLTINALTFLALVGVALSLRLAPGESRRTATPRFSLIPREGIAELRRFPELAVLVWALLPFVVALESVNAVEVFLVRDALNATPADYGLAEAVAGAGAVCGAFVAGAVRARRTRVSVIVFAICGSSLTQVGQGLAPAFLVYLVFGATIGLLLGMSNALIMTLLVDEVDEHVRARVLAFVNGASRTMTMAALVLGGTLNATVGPRLAYVIAGVLGFLVGVLAWWRMRRYRHRVERVDAGQVTPAGAP